MKIRFFNTYEPVSSFYRDLTPYLAQQGAKVEIVMSRAEYRRGRKLKQFLADVPDVRIVRMANLGVHADRGLWAKALVALLYFGHASIYALFGTSVSKNVFLAQPPLIPLLGWTLSALRKQPYICVVNDINTQTPVEMGAGSRASKLTRLLQRWTVFSWKRAEAIVVIGRCMRDRVRAMGVPAGKIHFIHQWANEVEIHPVSRDENSVRRDFDFGDRFVVLYAGNIGVPQYFEDFLDVAEKLRARTDILFVFIGEGSRRALIENRVREAGLKNTLLLPLLHDRYPLTEIMAAGDLHFVSLKEVWTGLGVPSKSYVIMAAGRPLVYQGAREGEIARTIQEEEIGQWVASGDVGGLTAAVLRYADDPDLRKLHGQRGRALVETRLGRRDALDQYVQLLLGTKP